MNLHLRRFVSMALSSSVLCGPAAFAQSYQSDYERLRQQGIEANDAAARAHGFEQQRQQAESERRQEEQRRAPAPGSSSSGPGFASGGSSYNPQLQADMKAARARLLKLAPLPDARNPLLGRWRVEQAGRAPKKGDLSQLLGMLANPGRSMCETLFGADVTEFKPKAWSSIDSYGDDSLGPIQYRGEGKVVWAIPESKVFSFFGFEFASQDRMTLVGVEGCTLVRASGAAARATAVPPGNARAAAAGPAAGAPPTAVVAPAPQRSTLARPSPEVCRNTLVDQIGKVGVNQVRAMSDVRFKDMPIEGKVPDTNHLRIDLRNSACDDPRIKAMLYDFDAGGMLQSITVVWDRPAGPAPAPIFAERAAALSRLFNTPPPQSTARLQADTSIGRLILQDMPERNLLLEAYAAKK